MAYTRKTWYNGGIVPDSAPEGTVAPAIDADNMNRIEDGIEENMSSIEEIASSIEEFASSTENWTFTLEDGSTVTKAVYVG